jgi:CRISPR-associated protein Cas2
LFVIVSYDVSTVDNEGRRRLRKVAKACEAYGQRVQNSVFECLVEPAHWVQLRRRLIDLANLEEDSLRFYFLGSNWRRRVEHLGAKPSIDPEAPLVV